MAFKEAVEVRCSIATGENDVHNSASELAGSRLFEGP
jgi:hypothetical protein